MSVFLDSSALVKNYMEESGSIKVEELVKSGEEIWFSELSVVEVVSALAKRVRIGELEAGEFETLKVSFFADINSGRYRISSFLDADKSYAVEALSVCGIRRSVKTLDALILASADRTVEVAGGIVLWVADRRMRKAAQSLGLDTYDPED